MKRLLPALVLVHMCAPAAAEDPEKAVEYCLKQADYYQTDALDEKAEKFRNCFPFWYAATTMDGWKIGDRFCIEGNCFH